MAITFSGIPLLIYVPGVYAEFDTSHAVRGVTLQPHESLIVGQMLGSVATAGQVYQIDSAQEGVALFGTGSQLAEMIAAYKAVDSLTPLSVIPVADDGAGTQASGSITWTGTATETRELAFYVAGHRIPVAVTTGDTASTVETNALAAFALVANQLSVTVAGDAGTGLDFTARHKGTIGNQISIGHSQLPGERAPNGLALTVTAMSSGATDPAYTGAVTSMADTQYHTVVEGLVASTQAANVLVAEMETRWGPMSQREGVLFGCKADSRANLTTLGNAYNSALFVLVGQEVSALMQTPWETAAKEAALSAKRAQTAPSLGLQNEPIPGSFAAKRGSRFTFDQRNTLLSDGVATNKALSTGGLAVERLVTTYQLNAQGYSDTALQDLTSVRTLAAMRYSFLVRMSQRFGQALLASDGGVLPSGLPIVTPSIARAEVIALAEQWVELGWMEGASMKQFKDELRVERSTVDANRLDFIIPPDLMNNMLVAAAKFSFIK